MPDYFNFTVKCTCGFSSNSPLREPVVLNRIYAGQDCKCGNAVMVIPLKKLDSGNYTYKLRICRVERESEEETPGM